MGHTHRLVSLSIVITLGVLAAPRADAVPVGLDTLVGGNSIQCGNLKFSQFSYLGDNPPLAKPADIKVDCIAMGNAVGLVFSDDWASTLKNGRIATDRLGFVVTGLNAEMIGGATLMADPGVNKPDDGVSISETLFGLVNGCPA